MKKVAYLGLPGSYSFLAAQNYFDTLKHTFVGEKTFKDIFYAVERKKSDLGILPLENSLTGSIYQTYDLLLESNLKIVGEVLLKINHCLLATKTTAKQKNIFAQLKKCYSHIEALKQCQKLFDDHKNIEPIFVQDTASGAEKLVKENELLSSAIANKFTAKKYGLGILAYNIGDNPNNYTRFVIVAKNEIERGTKVSLIFSVEHKPGSLLHTLEPYAHMGMNLTKIESRPMIGKPWEYIFFVDFEIENNKTSLTQLISEMTKHVKFLKILGKYEKGKIYES